ncbi:MAG: DNA damage-inducible protein D [Endomicrobia bacterium]|nr:DNA damage-inducible protein D [Endomicrobiia bacterium]MCL2506937.1 DNA damage-inducible protein D [Endomicrobiia bacterium]
MTEITIKNKSPFEEIKFIDENDIERWYARDLSKLLGYDEWRNFENVLNKAVISSKTVGADEAYHFVEINKMINLAKGANRKVKDFALSRYACYLIIQNADPAKPLVSIGQTYFAIQTRRQELSDRNMEITENEKRLLLRNEMKFHNKKLAAAAKEAGVELPLDYAIFQDYGYKGLYGGLGRKDIHKRKDLKKSQEILDYMGSTELAANLFRATQTEEKLKREDIKGKNQANCTHHEVGKKVRQTIKELGGTMPEDLPRTEKGIKQIETEKRKKLKQSK